MNTGTDDDDLFLLGHIRRAGARPGNKTVVIRAGAGSDMVYADRAYVKYLHKHLTPNKWGKWAEVREQVEYCDDSPGYDYCMIVESREGEQHQGVVAYLGDGLDQFYGTVHSDIVYAGNGERDSIHGLGGDDILIKDGWGGAALDGGSGNDLLWNQKTEIVAEGNPWHGRHDLDDGWRIVEHWPGGALVRDTVIAGYGKDLIHLPNTYHFDPDDSGLQNHTQVIGFDPDIDELKEYRSSFTSGPVSHSTNHTVIPLDQRGQWLPNVELLGRNFTLSEDAIEWDRLSQSIITQVRSRGAVTIRNTVSWFPLKSQSEITEVPGW